MTIVNAPSEASQKAPLHCDACDVLIAGEPAGEGVYLWARGDEIRYEPAPLCEACAVAIGATAGAAITGDEEGDG